MQKAGAKLMFLSTVFLIAIAACMPANAGVSRVNVQTGGPTKPIGGPQAPDGGATPPTCGPSTCPQMPSFTLK
jgi:hypothetical protein